MYKRNDGMGRCRGSFRRRLGSVLRSRFGDWLRGDAVVRLSLMLLLGVIGIVGLIAVPGVGYPAAAQGANATLVVRRFDIDPSDILSQEELATITDRYVGRAIPVDELNVMVAELDALYEAKGFVARAVLPAQTITDGIVHVQLIEGRIHSVIVDGNKHTKESFLKPRIGLQPGELVDLNVMADSLATFNATYDVQLRAELRPGEQFGTTDYIVHVGEPKNDRFTLWADNGGRSETGADRYGFTWTRPSLFGYRDPLGLTLGGGEGSRSASVSYSWPFGSTGTRLGIHYSYRQIDIVGGEFEDVGIGNDASNVNVDMRAPFTFRGKFPAAVSVAYGSSQSGMLWEGHHVAGTQNSVWQVGGSVQVPSPNSQWDFGYVLRTGPQSGTAAAFVTHKLSASWQRRWGPGVIVVGASGQMTDSTLLPDSEQNMLGGSDSNRGYPSGWRSGDQGYSVNAEYTLPLTSRIQGTLHLDHGGVMPYKGNEEPVTADDFLTSVGLAFNVQLTEIVGLRLLWGVPLDDHAQGNTFYFRMQANF